MKKYIIFALVILSFSSTAIAAPLTLWQYFGTSMPSFAQRAVIYADMTPDVRYTGSAQQNNALLGYLLTQVGDSPAPQEDPAPIFGAAVPDAGGIFQTSLATGILPTDTNMTLVANALRGGAVLSGYQCFTIDVGLSIAEYACGTVSGTSVTNLQRGIDLLTATTTNVSLEFPHRRGASVTITDFPILQILKHQANGEDSYPNMLNYKYDMDYSGASTTAVVSYGLLQRTSFAGVSNASESSKGIVELATQTESASSSPTGSSGAPLVLQAKYATSSPYTAGLYIPITQNNGKLNVNFIATSSTDTYNFGGPFSTTGTTTLATSTIYILNAGTINATSTINSSATGSNATSTFTGNVVIGNNASTTNLFVSNICIHCVAPTIVSTTSGACATTNGASCSLVATCTGSQKVAGGGGKTSSDQPAIVPIENYPSATNAWTFITANTGSVGNFTISTYAVCVNP